MIGPSGSGKLIQVGVSNRDEVLKRFGLPYRHTEHQRALLFTFYRKVGYYPWLSPGPCIIAGPGPAVLLESLLTEFDETGVLRRYDAGLEDSRRIGWDKFIESIPDKDDPTPGYEPPYPR